MIINRGAAEVDNNISRDGIFDCLPSRECNIYFIIPNRTLDPLLSEVELLLLLKRPIMVRGEPKRKEWTASYLYAYDKNCSSECSTWSLTFLLTNYVIKADDVKLNTRQRHFKGDIVHEAVLMQNRKFRQICLNLASTCSSRPNYENEYTHFMFLTINNEVIWSLKSRQIMCHARHCCWTSPDMNEPYAHRRCASCDRPDIL